MPALLKRAGIAAAVAALGMAPGCRRPAGPPPSDHGTAAPVRVAKAVRRDMPVYLTGLGKVQALNTVTLRPQVDGQIVSMAMQEGQDVKAGQLLIQIDPRPYTAALEQAEGKKSQDEAQLGNSRKTLERDRGLLAKGLLNQQSFDAQQAEADQLAALVRTDEAAVANARINLGFTRIVSPIDGRVGLRQIDPGNIVRASEGTGLAVVAQVRPIAVVFSLPDRDVHGLAAQIVHGAKGEVLAVERGPQTVLARGELAAIDNQIDPATGTIRLKAQFDNASLALWPGQFVDARLLVATLPRALVVPTPAVQAGPDGSYVFVAGDNHRVSIRPVTTAETIRGQTVITHGLTEGETVVVDGQYLLRAGTEYYAVP